MESGGGPNRAGFSCPHIVLIFLCVGFLFYRYNGGGRFPEISVISASRRYILEDCTKCHIVTTYGGVEVYLPYT